MSPTSPESGWEEHLRRLPEGLDELGRLAWLRARLPTEEARRAAELAALRGRARGRLADAERLWLTRQGLEQASDARVAEARARRFARRAAGGPVVDATAGIGSDLVALGRAGLLAVGIERDAWTAECLRKNLTSAGLPPHVVCGRAEAEVVRADWLFLDPDRRAGGRRTLDPEGWSPRWSDVVALVAGKRGACVKLPPLADPAQLERALPAGLAHSWQWVSLERELKELALWTGELAADEPREVLALRRAGDGACAGSPADVPALDGEAAAGVRWIADPDPALTCSGLLGVVARAQGLAPLARDLGYLGGDAPPDSALLASYEVLGSCALDRRRVRALLAEHDVGRLTVKKRGLSESARELSARLSGKGARRGTLIAARLEHGRRAYLVREAGKAD